MIVDTLPGARGAAAEPTPAVAPAATPAAAGAPMSGRTPARAAAPATADGPAVVAIDWTDALLAAALAPSTAADPVLPAAADGAHDGAGDEAAPADATATTDAGQPSVPVLAPPADWPAAMRSDTLASLLRGSAEPVPAAATAAAAMQQPPGATLPPSRAATGSPSGAAPTVTPAVPTGPTVLNAPTASAASAASVTTAAPVAALPPASAAAVPAGRAAGSVDDTQTALAAAQTVQAGDGVALPATSPGAAAAFADATPTLKLPAAATAWRQPLLQALGERMRLQIAGGAEQATIRLDPPLLGSIEIVVRHEAGAVQVHLSASHPDVQRQLQQLGEPLRHELAQRQGGEVSVEVARQGADADGRQRREPAPETEAEVGRALAEADADANPFTFPYRPAA